MSYIGTNDRVKEGGVDTETGRGKWGINGRAEDMTSLTLPPPPPPPPPSQYQVQCGAFKK